ncbi:hypothetical protein [Limnospira fusiformis]|uniref:hypothetical protein n=1 Tax=Limnospira fusiformis TaxID=54297 RepID=UPI00144A0B18|nr:hypothetical protein HFV01_05015 [Limnospira fusiformis SAG 85.79]
MYHHTDALKSDRIIGSECKISANANTVNSGIYQPNFPQPNGVCFPMRNRELKPPLYHHTDALKSDRIIGSECKMSANANTVNSGIYQYQ